MKDNTRITPFFPKRDHHHFLTAIIVRTLQHNAWIMNGSAQRKLMVEKAIGMETGLSDSDISVEVIGNVAVLEGTVSTYSKKVAAIAIARGIPGIKSVSDKISVIRSGITTHSDHTINESIVQILAKQLGLASDNVKVTVSNGRVTLDGNVKWKFQKQLASESISFLDGITNIENNISVPDTSPVV